MTSGWGVVPRPVGGPVAVRRAVRRAVGRAVAVVRGGVVTVASVGRAAVTVVPPMTSIQGVLCAARPAMPLVRRTVAATVVSTGMVALAVTSLIILLFEQLGQVLPRGLSPLVFSRAGFLVRGAVAVVGMAVLAGASGVVARLLLAPGWLVSFWWVA